MSAVTLPRGISKFTSTSASIAKLFRENHPAGRYCLLNSRVLTSAELRASPSALSVDMIEATHSPARFGDHFGGCFSSANRSSCVAPRLENTPLCHFERIFQHAGNRREPP